MIDPHHIEEFSTVPVLTLTAPPTLPTIVAWIFPRMTDQTPNPYHGCILSIISNDLGDNGLVDWAESSGEIYFPTRL